MTMRRGFIFAGLALAILAVPAGAAPKPPLVLEPTSQWNLDYAAERCSLLRRFGDEKDGVTLQIDSFGAVASFRFLIFGKAIPRTSASSSDVWYRFTPDVVERDQGALRGRSSGKVPAVSFNADFSAYKPSAETTEEEWRESIGKPGYAEPEFEALVNDLKLRFATGKHIQLNLGNMAKPLEALRTCVDDLKASWGLDPNQEKTLSRRPVPHVSTMTTLRTVYPSKAYNNGLSTFVAVRVMVGADGTPGYCSVQNDAVDPSFEQTVCRAFAAPFEPARDAAGNPVASFYWVNIQYVIR